MMDKYTTLSDKYTTLSKYKTEKSYWNFIEHFYDKANEEQHMDYMKWIDTLACRFETHVSANHSSFMNTFTIHDFSHSRKIMGYMYDLMVDPSRLNAEMYFYLAAAAICHDWGVWPFATDTDAIKQNRYITNQSQCFDWNSVYNTVADRYFNTELNIENLTLSIIVRSLHTNSEVIKKKISEIAPDVVQEIAPYILSNIIMICVAHGDYLEEVLSYKFEKHVGNRHVHFGYIIALLRVGDLLDIGADRLNPETEKYISADCVAKKHWLTNKLVKNVQIVREEDKPICVSHEGITGGCLKEHKYISFDFSQNFDATNDEILYNEAYDYLHQYIAYIEQEIKENTLALTQHKFFDDEETDFYTQIWLRNNIEKLRNLTNISFEKIRIEDQNLLNLITAESLYGDRRIALREVVQNAFDASRALLQNPTVSELRIEIESTPTHLIIRDHGIGMDLNTIRNYFLTVGKSIYHSNQYLYSNEKFMHAGNFGLGVFAMFMLSPTITVRTTKQCEGQQTISFTMRKDVSLVRIDMSPAGAIRGTEIRLEKGKEFVSCFDCDSKIKHYIENTFLEQDERIQLVFKAESSDCYEELQLNTFDNCLKNRYNRAIYHLTDLSQYFRNVVCHVALKESENLSHNYRYFNAEKKCFEDAPNYNNCDVVVKEYVSAMRKAYFIFKAEEYTDKYGDIKSGGEEYGVIFENDIIFDCISLQNEIVTSKGENKWACSIYRARLHDNIFYIIDSTNSKHNCDLRGSVSVFLHGILIENADFDTKILPDVDIAYVCLNIHNNETVPLLNRNNLNSDTLKQLRIALLLAVLQHQNEIRNDANMRLFIMQLQNENTNNIFINRESDNG